MRLQKVEAVVLRTSPFSETSLVGSLFTRQLGRIPVIAKGARRPGKAVAAALQPSNEIACVLYLKPQGGLRTVSQVELHTVYPALTSSVVRFGLAGRALELIGAQTPEEEVAPGIYFLLKEVLALLEHVTISKARLGLAAFELQLQNQLGYGLQVTACARCGGTLRGGREVLSPSAGGMLCTRCRGGCADLFDVTQEEVALLHQMSAEPIKIWAHRDLPSRTGSRVGSIIERVWEYHSPESRRSSSMSFLAEVGGELYSQSH